MLAPLLSLLLATSALALPTPGYQWNEVSLLEKRLVVSPPIVAPTAESVWVAGQPVLVQWDTSVLYEYPETLNYTGLLLLGHTTGSDAYDYTLDVDHPLAEDFPLKAGQITVTLPESTEPRDNAIVALLGDSGNISAKFTIKPAGSASQSASASSGSASASHYPSGSAAAWSLPTISAVGQ